MLTPARSTARSAITCASWASAEDQDGIRRLIDEVNIDIRYADGVQHMILNGEDVTSELRTPEMSMYASGVSAQPCVRAFLLDMQRQLAGRTTSSWTAATSAPSCAARGREDLSDRRRRGPRKAPLRRAAAEGR